MATVPCARSLRRRGIDAMYRIAWSSLSSPSQPREARLGRPVSTSKPSDVIAVTCQNRSSANTPSRPARLASPWFVNGPSIRRCVGSFSSLSASSVTSPPCHVLNSGKSCRSARPASVTSLPVSRRRSLSFPRNASIAPSPVGVPIRFTLSSFSQNLRLATPASEIARCQVMLNVRKFGKWRTTSRPRSVSLPPGYSLRSRCSNCGMRARCCRPSSVSCREPPSLRLVT